MWDIWALRRMLRREEVGPAFRRFFINTLFDSTFMLLGITIGSAFTANPDLKVILGTMITSSLALGISTGVSIYEAESLERGRKIAELERALFMDLEETKIWRAARASTLLISLLNFLTPLVACAIVVWPFALASRGILEIRLAAKLSVLLALATLFAGGVYVGKVGRGNPWVKGLRMVLFGLLAFGAGYIIMG